MLRREMRNEIKRYARRMSKGLVFMPDQVWQSRKKFFGTNNNFVVIRFKPLGNQPGIFKFVCLALAKRDRKSLYRLVDHAAHHGCYR
jgi:hypothetical protein